MSWIAELGSLICRFTAKAVEGPDTLARMLAVATLSVAESGLRLIAEGAATDILRLKESQLGILEARRDSAKAEAQKRVAEATEAVNKSNLHKRRDAVAQAEKRRLAAEAAKTEAEGQAIFLDAETRRIAAIAEAQARIIEAVSKLRQEGGDLLFDSENLKQILGQAAPLIENDDTEE